MHRLIFGWEITRTNAVQIRILHLRKAMGHKIYMHTIFFVFFLHVTFFPQMNDVSIVNCNDVLST